MNSIGILGINKPSGMTSFDVVRKVKQITKIKKIGHGGTLDPMAEGVLLILLNEATGFFDVLLSSPKIYEVTIQLGAFTDTDDKEGSILQTLPVPDISLEEIKARIPFLTGEILQTPPIYSALKVEGKRAYDLAREGKKVVLEPRKVTVYQWTDLQYDPSNYQIKAVIHCGSGTYIRSLGRDLSKMLHTGGHLIALKRSSSGGVHIDQTLSLEDLAVCWEEKLITAETALSFLPSIEWEGTLSHLKHGKPLWEGVKQKISQEGVYRLMYNHKIMALVQYYNRQLRYQKNLSHLYKD